MPPNHSEDGPVVYPANDEDGPVVYPANDEDVPVVYPANAFDSRLRGDYVSTFIFFLEEWKTEKLISPYKRLKL